MLGRKTSLLLGFALAAATPSAAWAVSFGSGDGTATQSRTATLSNGANSSGTLRSYASTKYVYINLKVEQAVPCADYWESEKLGAGNTNYTGSGGVPRSGYGGSSTVCDFDNLRAHVCRDISYRPDPCGVESAKY